MSDQSPVKKKALPGWYEHPKKPGFERLWDGVEWMDDVRLAKDPLQRGMTAGGMIGLGTPPSAATCAMGRPSTTTRSTRRRRPSGVSGEFLWVWLTMVPVVAGSVLVQPNRGLKVL